MQWLYLGELLEKWRQRAERKEIDKAVDGLSARRTLLIDHRMWIVDK